MIFPLHQYVLFGFTPFSGSSPTASHVVSLFTATTVASCRRSEDDRSIETEDDHRDHQDGVFHSVKNEEHVTANVIETVRVRTLLHVRRTLSYGT